MKKEHIKKILINELNYTDYEANVTADSLIGMQARFHPALEKWVENREETDIGIGAVSAASLMHTKGFTYPAALIALDWIASDPDTAIPVLTSDIKP